MDPLNPAQREAVEHDTGPLLVLAGAGSGKTRVVTTRIARLLERGVLARSILAMTFTNKAAAEMKERVARMVGPKLAGELSASTFHSFGLHVLSAEARAMGLRNGQFTIFDDGDASGAMREILRGLRIDRKYDVGAILARISQAKANLWSDDQLPDREGDDYDEITRLALPRYRAALQGFSAFDFDDLVTEPVLLWRRRPEILARWQERYRYILVDEYQDTNHAQLELVRLLSLGHRNVAVVGDDDQSIYAWRGADVSNILEFEKQFPGAKIVMLEQNYRSTPGVLAVANAVLARTAAKRHPKVLRATRDAGDVVSLVAAEDSEIEASFVGDELKRLHEEGLRPSDAAVLYRSNRQSELIESALKERGLRVRVLGGAQFYERKEVKDLLAYLRVALNPRDELALRRVLNYPARQIGESSLEKLVDRANRAGGTLYDAVSNATAAEGLPPAAAAGCAAFIEAVERARASLAAGKASAEVARELIDAVGLRADVFDAAGSGPQAARRWGNVEALLRVLERHDARKKPAPLEALGELIRLLMLQPGNDDEPESSAVTMTTMHGAKGLEYRVVFIVGLEEGLLPHARTLDARATDVGGTFANDVEEERRLFYVSITRARDRLYLCRAKHRLLRGKMIARAPSRFLADIPAELVTPRTIAAKGAPTFAATQARGAALLASLGAAPAGRPGRGR